MSDVKLFLSFDTFYPAIYSHGDLGGDTESYEHERPYLYFVLLPVLMLPEGVDSARGLETYFNWTSETLDEPDRFDILSASSAEIIKAQEEGRLLPVPFPPGTTINYDFSLQDNDTGDIKPVVNSRTLGGYKIDPIDPATNDSLLLPATEWPLFSIANFSIPNATKWTELTAPQKADVVEWCTTVIDSLNANKDSLDDVESELRSVFVEGKEIFKPSNDALMPLAREIWKTYQSEVMDSLRQEFGSYLTDEVYQDLMVRVDEAQAFLEILKEYSKRFKTLKDLSDLDDSAPKDPTDPTDSSERLRLWRAELIRAESPDGDPITPLAEAIYDRAVSVILSEESELKTITAPPIFQLNKEILRNNPDRVLSNAFLNGTPDEGKVLTALSYHRRLWEELKSMIASQQEGGAEELKNALQRLFGLGERLRWPKPTVGNDTNMFMWLSDRSRRIEAFVGADNNPDFEWFTTNVFSLAGQVIRLGPLPLNPSTNLPGSVSVEINGLNVGPIGFDNASLRQNVKDIIEETLKQVSNANPDNLKVAFTRDRSFDNGVVYYMPKTARGPQINLQSSRGSIFEVPKVLLDEVDPTPRQDFPIADFEDKDNLIVINPPRTGLQVTELYRADIVTKGYKHFFRAKVAIDTVALQGLNESAFQLTLKNEMELEEWAFLAEIFIDRSRRGYWSSYLPKLWGTKKSANENADLAELAELELMGIPVLDVPDDDVIGKFYVSILLAEKEGKIARFLSEIGAKEGEPSHCDFVVEVQFGQINSRNKHDFANVWVDKEATRTHAPLFMLNNAFTSNLGRSVQRIAERYQVEYPKLSSVDDELIGDLQQYNKARLTLSGQGDVRADVALSYPEADIPLIAPEDLTPEEREDINIALETADRFDEVSNPFYSYLITHIFAQQVQDDPLNTEQSRFENYRSAGKPWELKGYLENQYSYRLPISYEEANDGGSLVYLSHSTETRHISEINARGKPGASERSSDVSDRKTDKAIRPFATFDYIAAEDGIAPSLRISLRKNVLRIYLAAYENPDQAETGGTERPAQLRELYEALMDLNAGLTSRPSDQTGNVIASLEGWNFDNNSSEVQADNESDLRSYPSIARNMRCDWQGKVPLKPIATHNAAAMQKLKDLLSGSFSQFVAQLRLLAEFADDEEPVAAAWWEFDIPLSGPFAKGWVWTNRPEHIPLTTNAIRLGLTVRRPVKSVTDDVYSEKDLIGMLPSMAETKEFPDLEGETFEDPALKKAAAEELNAFFDSSTPERSVMYERFLWLMSADQFEDQELNTATDDDIDRFDPMRKARLFGESLPYLNFLGSAKADICRVMNGYFVPHAFIPLKAHPMFLDAKTTTEFAQFIIKIASEIAAGKTPSEVNVADSDPLLTPADAFQLQKDSKDLIGGKDGIADQLVELITYVDDKDEIEARWGNSSNPTHLQEKKLFDDVYALLEQISSERNDHLKNTLHAMLVANPQLFLTAKGFGICIFDEETFSPRLYDLQLTKQIRPYQPLNTIDKDKHADEDRITFAQFHKKGELRYFIDILDDKTYDNEFQIAQSEFEKKDSNGVWQPLDLSKEDRRGHIVDLKQEEVRLLKRGDCLGRLAEDHINQSNQFARAKAKQRAVELNWIHYNPEWRVREEAGAKQEEYYILPSRFFPTMPIALRPKQDEDNHQNVSVAGHQDNPWRSIIMYAGPDADGPSLAVAFEEKIREQLEIKRTVFVPGALSGDSNLTLTREESIEPVLLKDNIERHTSGWHHIESYLSHYYFIITTDEESFDTDQPLSNDAIDIFVETQDTPFNSQIQGIKLQRAEPVSHLHQWFLYSKNKAQGADVEPPEAVNLSDIVSEVGYWVRDYEDERAKPFTKGEQLISPRTISDLQATEYRAPRNTVTDAEFEQGSRYVVRSRFLKNGGTWSLSEPAMDGGPRDGIGNPVATEIFRINLPDGTIDKSRYVLRLSVLDEPWKFTRARIRVKRNFRDVDGNNDPDINPIFVMNSPLSDWSDYGRQPLVLGPPDFERFELPELVAKLKVVPDIENNVPSLEEWYELEPTDGNTVSFGPLVARATRDATFTLSTTSAEDVTHHYWNEKEITKSSRSVQGIIEQEVQQRSIRHGLDGSRMGGISELDWRIPREFLKHKKADKLDLIATNILKSETPGLDLNFRVTWSSDRDELPLLTVVWPVGFERSS